MTKNIDTPWGQAACPYSLATQPAFVFLHRFDQDRAVGRPFLVDLIVGDDLVLRLLHLQHLAKLVRPAGLALAYHFRRRLEHAQQLVRRLRLAIEDAPFGLPPHWLHAPDHLLDLLAQPLQQALAQRLGRAFDALFNFFDEAPRLGHHASADFSSLP